ncbi:MAG: hypothetical protein ABI647_17170 [Gemmatimonadota bacterium]
MTRILSAVAGLTLALGGSPALIGPHPRRHPLAAHQPEHLPYAAALSTPHLFGEGVISTADDEFGGAFTKDGKTVYFTKSAPGSYRYTICESHWLGGRWTTPVVSPFSGRYSDSDPVFSPDGSKLFWTSDRPVDGAVKHDYDIWMVEKRGAGWSAPIHLPAPINSEASEFFASMSKSGVLYFSSSRRGGATGAIEAYRSRQVGGKWTEPENVSRMINGPDSAAYYDLDVMIDPDERFVLLSSLGRPDGFGHYDLYVAWRRGDGWSRPIHLPAPFNTAARDYSPHLSPDGKYLFFASERGFALDPIDRPLSYRELLGRIRGTLNGSGNIYQVETSTLEAFDPEAGSRK